MRRTRQLRQRRQSRLSAFRITFNAWELLATWRAERVVERNARDCTAKVRANLMGSRELSLKGVR